MKSIMMPFLQIFILSAALMNTSIITFADAEDLESILKKKNEEIQRNVSGFNAQNSSAEENMARIGDFGGTLYLRYGAQQRGAAIQYLVTAFNLQREVIDELNRRLELAKSEKSVSVELKELQQQVAVIKETLKEKNK